MKEKLPKIYLVLKILGIILCLAGLALLITSFCVDDSFSEMEKSVGFMFGGMVGLMIGIIMMSIGFTPNMQKLMIKTQKHIINENREDLKDIANTQADVSKGAVKTVAGAVKEGMTEEVVEEKMFCKHCGKEIDKDSKFCQYCGKEQ